MKPIVGPRHRQAAHDVEAGRVLAARRAQELAPRGHLGEQVLDPHARSRRQRGGAFARPARRDRPRASSPGPRRARRLSSVSRATLAIEGSASPRKPSVATCSIASSGSFEVAWRSSASAISSGVMPQPSSVTSIQASPPSSILTAIRVAPASIAFSTSSLSAEAGRSTTSPAAMRLTSVFGQAADCRHLRDRSAEAGGNSSRAVQNRVSYRAQIFGLCSYFELSTAHLPAGARRSLAGPCAASAR